MSVTKDGDTGRWMSQIRVTDWTGKTIHKKKRGFATKKEALQWERDFISQSTGSLGMTFGDFISLYVKDMEHRLKPSTVASKKWLIDLKVTPFFKKIPLNEIKPMLGCEIDFIVKGVDQKTRTVVASRKEAMLKKRQVFYMNQDASGAYRIYEGRTVQARVIAVAEKAVRIEAFGVECSIMARDLSWDWIGDANDRFSVGDQILVRILEVNRDSLEELSIRADVKSVSENTNRTYLKQCRVQSKYAGKVTDVHKGVVYVRLNNGANAIAHTCLDRRTPGKKDDVSFAVTHIDEDRGVAVGIITRIIKQHL